MTIMSILDANLNRAREAARVLEEYARFILRDARLTERAKDLRHQVSRMGGDVLQLQALGSRDSQQDPGTAITSASEKSREGVRDVVRANALRLAEALRAIEEWGKLSSEALAAQAKQLRYQCYELEQALLAGPGARVRSAGPLMLLVTASICALDPTEVIAQAAQAGVRIFQLREKHGSDRERFHLLEQHCQALRSACPDAIAIVNDRVDLALALGADGVHLGDDDLPIAAARAITGPSFIIGQSTHNLEEVRIANGAGADYLGAGAAFSTTTKAVVHKGGPAFAANAAHASDAPVFAIGGIDRAGAMNLRALGVERIAVCSAVCSSPEPGKVCQELISILSSSERAIPSADIV